MSALVAQDSSGSVQGTVHNAPWQKMKSEIGSVELWRDSSPKYSAIPVVLCHAHVSFVDTGKPVEQHVPLTIVLDQDSAVRACLCACVRPSLCARACVCACACKCMRVCVCMCVRACARDSIVTSDSIITGNSIIIADCIITGNCITVSSQATVSSQVAWK